ncbi:MAG: Biopolymer transport protein ExbB [Pseudomonadota bacterium]
MQKSINWKPVLVTLALALVAVPSFAAEGGKHPSMLDQMKDAGFVEYLLLLVSIAGFALALQALVSIRAHLIRPPELATELQDLLREGNLEGAFDVAQGDSSMLGVVAAGTLANAQYGKDAMEGAMADVGEIESNKYMNKIGVLNMIAAIAPMLGLTGTTVGMIETFTVMAAGGAEITADKMAKGISIALICTFTGLMVAIPLLCIAFFLKAKVTQIVLEVSNDCNELVRYMTGGAEEGK